MKRPRCHGGEPLCRKEDRRIARDTDGPWDLGVPRFGLEEVERLADLLVHPFLGGSLTPPRAESESA